MLGGIGVCEDEVWLRVDRNQKERWLKQMHTHGIQWSHGWPGAPLHPGLYSSC